MSIKPEDLTIYIECLERCVELSYTSYKKDLEYITDHAIFKNSIVVYLDSGRIVTIHLKEKIINNKKEEININCGPTKIFVDGQYINLLESMTND